VPAGRPVAAHGHLDDADLAWLVPVLDPHRDAGVDSARLRFRGLVVGLGDTVGEELAVGETVGEGLGVVAIAEGVNAIPVTARVMLAAAARRVVRPRRMDVPSFREWD